MNSLYGAKPVVFTPRDFIKVAASGLILVIIQASGAALVGLSGYGPEWMLVLVVFVALRSDLGVAVLAAFVLGFFRDAVGGLLLGLWPFTLVLIIWLFYPFRSRLNFFNPLTLAPLIFILTFGGYLFVMTPVMAITGWPGHNFNPLPPFLVSSSLTAVTAPFLFAFLQWLTKGPDQA